MLYQPTSKRSGLLFQELETILNRLHTDVDQVMNTLQSGRRNRIAALLDHLLMEIDAYAKGDNKRVGELAHPTPGALGATCPRLTVILQEPAIDFYAPEKNIQSVYQQLMPLHGSEQANLLAQRYYALLFINECLLHHPVQQLQHNGYSIGEDLYHLLQCPSFPSSYFHLDNREKKPAHTWGYIYKVLRHPFPHLNFQAQVHRDSLFRYAQIRDLNHMPSKTNPRSLVTNVIQRNFEYTLSTTYDNTGAIWYANSSYLNKYIGEQAYAKEIARTYKVREVAIPKELRTISQVVRLFKSCSRVVLVTHQLSGSCAWSNASLEAIANYLIKR